MAVSYFRSLRDDDVLSLRRRAARLSAVPPASCCRSGMRSCIVRERGGAVAATAAGQAPATEGDYSPGISVSAFSPKFPPSRLPDAFDQVVEPLIAEIT
jgi:hypothetical protein